MAHVFQLTDTTYGGSTTVDLTEAHTAGTNRSYGIATQGNRFGELPQDGEPREIVLNAFIRGTSQSVAWQNVRAAQRLLEDAREYRLMGLGRRVVLKAQLDGASAATFFEVLEGDLEDIQPLEVTSTRNNLIRCRLALRVEPWGHSAETATLTSGQTIYGQNKGITHCYVHHTGATSFGSNTASLVEGSFWQSDCFTATPTNQTPAGSDILYFGNDTATFDRLIFGLKTAASGITWTSSGGQYYQFWNGSAWTYFTPDSDSFKTSVPLDTTANLGQIVWTVSNLTGWATTAINGVTAYWIRLVVTSVSSPTAPVRMNGPVSSHYGVGYIAASGVDGDLPAAALVHLANAASASLAGVRAGLVVGRLSTVKPPLYIEAQGADLYAPVSGTVTDLTITNRGSGYSSAPSVSFSGGAGAGAAATATVAGGQVVSLTLTNRGSGYTSAPSVSFSGGGGSGAAATSNVALTTVAATATDTQASLGERATVTLNAATDDRGLLLDGTDDYITHTASSSGKLDISGKLQIDVIFKLTSVPTGPAPLCARWTSGSTKAWWLGIDQGKLRWMVSTTGSDRKAINGTTALEAGRWYHARAEFTATAPSSSAGLSVGNYNLYLYLDGQIQAKGTTNTSTIKATIGTAVRVGQSTSFATADSKSGDASEVALPATIACYRVRVPTETMGRTYSLPTSGWTDDSTTRLLCQCNDNAASTTVTDSATTYAAASNGTLTNAGNTSVSTTGGYFQAGAGGQVRVLGWRLPDTLGKEYAGSYRVCLFVKPASAPSSVDDLEFYLQVGLGDSNLPFTTRAGRKIPEEAAPTGYFCVDMGTVTLPPGRLEDYRSTASAREFLQAHLWIKHRLTASTDVYVDGLLFVPTDLWQAEYDTFYQGLSTSPSYPLAYEMVNGAGVLWDATAPDLVVAQTSTSGYTVQTPSPYARVVPAAPRLLPNKPHWLIAVPLRGTDSGDDYLSRNASDTLTPTVLVMPRWRHLAP